MWHAKLRLDPNSKVQTQIPEPACDTPRDAALRLAKYRANPFPIERKARVAKDDGPRAIKGHSKGVFMLVIRSNQPSCILMTVCACCLTEAEGRGGA